MNGSRQAACKEKKLETILKKLVSFKVYLVNNGPAWSVPMFINATFPLTRNSGSFAQGGV